MISVSKNHPVATYCLLCNELGDVPLCLLRPSAIQTLLLNLPDDNFHKIFWSKPPPVIRSEGKTYTHSILEGAKESFSPYLIEASGHYGTIGTFRSTTTEDLSPIVTAKQSSEHAVAEVAGNPFTATAASPVQTSSARKRRQTLFVGTSFISESHSPNLESQKEVLEGAVGHVQVPAAVLLAYCVARSWSFGGKWIGTNAVSSKAGFSIVFASLLSYLIPGAMRVVEPTICTLLGCDFCRTFVCHGRIPAYVGNHWIDIVCHLCWIFCTLFWFRLVLSFVTIQLFELSRRAKLTEEWADTLRHGRDSSFNTGMRLTSKESVMTWYHCREVTRRFRAKLNSRLTAVSFFMFLIPLISLLELGFGMFDRNSLAAAALTPKFFVQVMFYSLTFLTVIVFQIFSGSSQNTNLEHENLMLSRLIAHMQCVSCDSTRSASDDSNVRLSAVQEIIEGLSSVSSALKLMKGFTPDKLFFVFPASMALLGSLASAFSVAVTFFADRFAQQPCVVLEGVRRFYDERFQC